MKVTDMLDVIGVAMIATFAGLVWTPLCLLVIGLAALAMSWKASR
ncbi:hypothetical protein [Pimelobacter simplex]